MDASEPSRKNKKPKQMTVEILGSFIALTTLILPVFLITNFSGQYHSNPLSGTSVLWLKK